ncbi:hypothetical protein ACWDXH_04945 [Micromonospora chokoriensis]
MDVEVGASDGGASGGEVPLVVCVSADAAMVERVLRQLGGTGQVVSCPDLAELRAMLFPSPHDPSPTVPQEPAQPV